MKKTLIIGLIFILFNSIFYVLSGGSATSGGGSWYSVAPPIIAVCLALLTHKLLISLFIAVLVGGFLVKVPVDPVSGWHEGAFLAGKHMLGSLTDTTNLQILAFVLCILTMITLLGACGALGAVATKISRWAKGRRSTKFITALMGLLIFIDDYANSMIVGSTMRPLTDKNKISREKLAFIVDATSAPVAGLAVVSTWIGYEVGLFADISKTLNLGATGYSMFFDAIAFRFYCFLMLGFVFLQILIGDDFGPMKEAEEKAQREGVGGETLAESVGVSNNTSRHMWTALIPIASLLVALFYWLWLDGGGPEKFSNYGTMASVSYWRDVIGSAENSILILAYTSAGALVLTIFLSLTISRIQWSHLGHALFLGIKKGLFPVYILVLAWSLKAVCGDLKTGEFLATLLGDVISPIWFPFILFLISALTAFSTGTSWGTMAILIPTAIPLAYQLDGNVYGIVTMISLGSILDGAIMGDHCSPISDTTILSATASSCDTISHVRTQMPYSLLVAAVAVLCGYLPASLGVPSWVGLSVGFLFLTAFLIGVRWINKAKTA